MTDAAFVELVERYRSGLAAVQAAVDAVGPDGLDRGPAGGWTARKVIHHLADSETNSYIRLRRLVAEDSPVISAYDEELWSERLHYDRPLEASLAVLSAVRQASLELLLALSDEERARSGTHSDTGDYSVTTWLQTYADHCHDHAAQITAAGRD